MAEMTEQVGISVGKIGDMRDVGVGEGIKRQVLRRAGQERLDAGYFADEDRVPSFKKFGVREIDAELGTQARKERRVADLSLFMTVIEFVARKPPHQMLWLASGVAGPAAKCPVEIDVEHHAAEVEQQGIGIAG